MYSEIPEELRALPQWVCVGLNKIPLDPKTGTMASVTNSETWGTFEQACENNNGAGIGFVFTDEDPYTFIDLDDPNKKAHLGPDAVNKAAALNHKIFCSFNSYAELSQSGNGVHIIVRGRVPAGARRDTVEIYSTWRYAIFTGKRLNNSPILPEQPMLDILYSEMHPISTSELVQVEGRFNDEQVVDMASSAINGDKFNKLCRGEWQDMGYPSQSEADFALMSILAFYTPDNEQVRRLFRMTVMGQRSKAQKNDKYLNYALKKIRGSEPPTVDLSKLSFEVGSVAAPVPAERSAMSSAQDASVGELAVQVPGLPVATVTQHKPPELTLPPGLAGQIANYIFSSAVRPVPEVAIAGALALMAGLCGRAYNISRTGLNQYIVLLAPTGSGKEAAASGIDNLLREARMVMPAIMQFNGPSVFSSGQSVLRCLEKNPCFFSVLGEFGITLQQLSNPRASNAELMLRRVLLDLYTKSGWGRVLNPMVYSDKEKNTAPVMSPALTILGESAPSRFYEGLDVANVEEGLVPRFIIIESNGDGPPRNRNAGHMPDKALVQAVADLATTAYTMSNNNSCMQVELDPTGEAVFDQFEALCDHMRSDSSRGADKELWSRAYLKAIKLAGLLAVGVDMHRPIVTADIAHWAIGLIQSTTETIVRRFNNGEIGQGEVQHESEIRKAVHRYIAMTPAQRKANKCPADLLEHEVIPFSYLRDQLRRRASFRDAKQGLVRAIEVAVKDAIAAGILKRIPASQMVANKIISECYAVGPML